MPDFVLLTQALLVSAVAAGAVLLLVAWPRRAKTTSDGTSWRSSIGWIWGLGAGIYAGCVVLDQWPRWPAPEDRDRFLVILLPLTLAVETAAVWIQSARWTWLLRSCIAAAAAPILLHNSAYLADLAGPSSAEWSRAEAAWILLGLATSLAGVWALLSHLQKRTGGRTAPGALALTAFAAAATVMLSGYYRGGLLAVPIAGALTGVTLASFAKRAQPAGNQSLGIGLIGIFSVVLIGRFFGALPTSLAICLLLAPLLAWISELPSLHKLSPRNRAALALIAVILALSLIVARARFNFLAASAARSHPGQTP